VIVLTPLRPPGPPRSFTRAFTIGGPAPPGTALPATWQLAGLPAALHCVIAPSPALGAWVIKDLGAGTAVNGLRVSAVTAMPLHRGDRLACGGAEFEVIPDPP